MSEVQQYVKKPVIISAMHIGNNEDTLEVCEWVLQNGGNAIVVGSTLGFNLKIDTLEGTMTGKVGDYIIQGVDGEFYPCKGSIFEKTYDEILEVENG